MKKILIIFMLFASCGKAMNVEECLNSVKKEFPNSKIYLLPNSNFTFIVVDTLGIRKVTTMNITDADIDNVISLKRVQ